MRKVLLVVIIAVAVTALVLFGLARFAAHTIQLKANFQDAHGLHEGAPVRIAGVNVGFVTSVRVRPELHQSAAEVVMELSTPYELNIPLDATARLETEGVLGAPFVEIDVSDASGEPASNGTVLKSKETETVSTKEFIEKIGNVLNKASEAKSRTQNSDSGSTDDDKQQHKHK